MQSHMESVAAFQASCEGNYNETHVRFARVLKALRAVTPCIIGCGLLGGVHISTELPPEPTSGYTIHVDGLPSVVLFAQSSDGGGACEGGSQGGSSTGKQYPSCRQEFIRPPKSMESVGGRPVHLHIDPKTGAPQGQWEDGMCP